MSGIVILVGSETGNSVDYAERTSEELERFNLKSEIHLMDEFKLENLLGDSLKCLIFICSTTGDGEEPRNMRNFMRFLLRSDLPVNILNSFSFSVFGLGDSSYDKFNFVGKRVYRRMQQLGAKDLIGFRGEGDERHPRGGIEAGWNVWSEALLIGLSIIYPTEMKKDALDSISPLPARLKVVLTPEKDISTTTTTDDKMIVKAEFVEAIRVTPVEHFQDTRLLRIKCSDPLKFAVPGDIMNLKPSNDSESVDLLLELMGWDGDQEIFGIEGNISSVWSGISFPITLNSFIRNWIDLHRIPTRTLLKTLACLCNVEAAEYSVMHREKLLELSRDEGEYLDYVWRPKRSVLEIIRDFQPTLKFDLDRLLQVFSPIKPRQFSIANDNESVVELLIAFFKEEMPLGRGFREGLCSKWISSGAISRELTFVTFTHGSIKHNLLKNTIFLFASGTGVAPLRSLIQRYGRDEGRRIYLYFGCRSVEMDFYFKDEWQREYPNLTVFALGSRDDPANKKYLDSIIKDNSGPLIEECESPDQFSCVVAGHSRLNKLVQDTLKEIWSSKPDFEGKTWLDWLKAHSQYQSETWS